MRTLYLLRHAKAADPATTGWTDIDRPLTDRGRRDAANLGDHLRLSGCRPQLIVCSPALRTRQTLDGVAPGLGLQAQVQVDDRLYGASAHQLWYRIRELSDGVDEAMLVGHNPGMQELAASLADHGDDRMRTRIREKMPTCTFVTVAWDSDSWAELRRSNATLHDVLTPRDFLSPR